MDCAEQSENVYGLCRQLFRGPGNRSPVRPRGRGVALRERGKMERRHGGPAESRFATAKVLGFAIALLTLLAPSQIGPAQTFPVMQPAREQTHNCCILPTSR